MSVKNKFFLMEPCETAIFAFGAAIPFTCIHAGISILPTTSVTTSIHWSFSWVIIRFWNCRIRWLNWRLTSIRINMISSRRIGYIPPSICSRSYMSISIWIIRIRPRRWLRIISLNNYARFLFSFFNSFKSFL